MGSIVFIPLRISFKTSLLLGVLAGRPEECVVCVWVEKESSQHLAWSVPLQEQMHSLTFPGDCQPVAFWESERLCL